MVFGCQLLSCHLIADPSVTFILKLLEEMKTFQVKPKGETYICLLNACAATGRTDQVYVSILYHCMLRNLSSYF